MPGCPHPRKVQGKGCVFTPLVDVMLRSLCIISPRIELPDRTDNTARENYCRAASWSDSHDQIAKTCQILGQCRVVRRVAAHAWKHDQDRNSIGYNRWVCGPLL